jgi:hypothetical protein
MGHQLGALHPLVRLPNRKRHTLQYHRTPYSYKSPFSSREHQDCLINLSKRSAIATSALPNGQPFHGLWHEQDHLDIPSLNRLSINLERIQAIDCYPGYHQNEPCGLPRPVPRQEATGATRQIHSAPKTSNGISASPLEKASQLKVTLFISSHDRRVQASASSRFASPCIGPPSLSITGPGRKISEENVPKWIWTKTPRMSLTYLRNNSREFDQSS